MAVSKRSRKAKIDGLRWSTARRVNDRMLTLSRDLNESLKIAKTILPRADFLALRATTAQTMAALYLDILVPIHGKFPDLKPAGLGGPKKQAFRRAKRPRRA